MKDFELVHRDLLTLEFPMFWVTGHAFGLIATLPYIKGIEALRKNDKFIQDCMLRNETTELILREIWEHTLESDRGQRAVQRLNFIHSHFDIPNWAYLYVLANFVVPPVELINKLH